jgi:hypothetical protein
MANLVFTPRRLIRSGKSRVKRNLAVGSGRCGRRERDERQDHPQIVRTELDPVDYRLEQISSSGIGRQALPQALCL